MLREQKYKSLSSIFSFIFLPLKVSLSKGISVNLYKEYSYLKLRDLEELPCFGVMIWQPFRLL